jgi:DNA adenine methylase
VDNFQTPDRIIQGDFLPPVKPLVSYYGGKQRIASKIIPYLEAIPHTVRAIPFAGGLGMEFKWPRPIVTNNGHYRIVINDIDEDLINLYRVAREHPAEFRLWIELTPYSQADYKRSAELLRDQTATPLQKAWAIYVNLNCSFANKKDAGWRTNIIGQNSVATWQNKINNVGPAMAWLSDVHIACEEALRFVERWDSPQTLFYLDPPYPGADQGHYGGYTLDDWTSLCNLLDQCQGSYVLSNYVQSIEPKSAQQRVEIQAIASSSGKGQVGKGRDKSRAATSEEIGDRKRTEILWICDRSSNIRPDLIDIAKRNAPLFKENRPEPTIEERLTWLETKVGTIDKRSKKTAEIVGQLSLFSEVA